MRTAICLAGLCLLAACASAPRTNATLPSLEAVDARVLQGCYDCLLEARDVYQRAAVGETRPLVILRLFESELLIALREKELALDPAATLARARALARELPPTLGADRYLDDVEAMPATGAGWPRREMAAFRQAHQDFAGRVDEEIGWIRGGALTPAVADYLALSLDCAYEGRPRPAGQPGQPVPRPSTEPPTAGPTLIRYRRATCRAPVRGSLEAVRAEVPGFVEASYFLGRVALGMLPTGGGADPHALVAEALQRFPDSPAVTYLAGTVQQIVGDCQRALVSFDRTLALKPAHEDAWLGRTICLTDLNRPDEAIDSATRMIGLALDNATQALYWRAWNRHARGELAEARADIDAARRGLTENILTLSGIIEHDQDDLGPAEADLQTVRRMSSGQNCRAMSYLASVFVKRQVWPQAAATFELAMTCYEADVQGRESTLAKIEERRDLDPQFKLARVTQLRAEIEAQRRGFFTTALHAANYSAATGDLARAKRLIDAAAKDPELKSQVDEVRAYIDRLAARSPGSP